MSSIKIYPGKLQGTVRVPPSKSLAHRAIICGALGSGTSILQGMAESADIRATLKGMEVLGARTKKQGDRLQITGLGQRGVNDRKPSEKDDTVCINCNESGSTLRFLIPLALTVRGAARFIGEGNLGKRPMAPYYEIFEKQGIRYQRGNPNEGLDLSLHGNWQSGEFRLPGDVSSQFISGLLFALPLLEGDSKIIPTSTPESRSYIDMTLAVMRDFGVEAENRNYHEFLVPGRQRYQSRSYAVEGDYSQAAFFLAAGAMGSPVEVSGLSTDSLQGDRMVLSILEQMGARCTEGKSGMMVVVGSDGLHSTIIDGAECPDIIPILAAAAALGRGTTEIINAGRLRFKECDRLEAVRTELCKMGARITEKPDGLVIEGVAQLEGGTRVWSHQDHRIAMMLAIAATRCRQPIILDDPECVKKSYPDFWCDYRHLGGQTEIVV